MKVRTVTYDQFLEGFARFIEAAENPEHWNPEFRRKWEAEQEHSKSKAKQAS